MVADSNKNINKASPIFKVMKQLTVSGADQPR
jgi:hypothetical protein